LYQKDGELKMRSKNTANRPSWREYQNSLKKPTPEVKRSWRRITAFAAGIMICCAAAWYYIFSSTATVQTTQVAEKQPPEDLFITKKDVQILLQDMSVEDLSAQKISIPMKNQHIYVKTSLDPSLQNHLLQSMDRKNSRYIGIVVMQAVSGRILALAGFNKIDPEQNPCIQRTFPAASIFKIVTAAAAVDHCGYSADTAMRFNGYKHTLYKNQLKEQNNRYTNTLSFKDAFAQSVNPVFGKLGTIKLGKNVLEEYAIAFGFNQPIQFELAVIPSQIEIKSKPYHWAEIASGFNNDTAISPVHGAMMASAVLNEGRMVAPTIVDRIEDHNGNLLYQSQPKWRGRAMTSRASGVLANLMETTIRSGTGRKSFRNHKHHKVLSKLRIGGKTGNIFNRSHDARFDWFVGFAQEKKGQGRLVFAALVAHEEFIGIRATQYARIAMTHYFKSQIAQRENKEIPDARF
jgi:cell division protein FtsI/penicillin-binding protein 2